MMCLKLFLTSFNLSSKAKNASQNKMKKNIGAILARTSLAKHFFPQNCLPYT
jgi:hypothetical protein